MSNESEHNNSVHDNSKQDSEEVKEEISLSHRHGGKLGSSNGIKIHDTFHAENDGNNVICTARSSLGCNDNEDGNHDTTSITNGDENEDDTTNDNATGACIHSEYSLNSPQQQKEQQNQQYHQESTSIAELLSVPIDYILRQSQVQLAENYNHGNNAIIDNSSNGTSIQNNNRSTNHSYQIIQPPFKKQKQNHSYQQQFLMSKTEAMTLIQITNLAHELDCLVQMATNALYKAHVTRQLSIDISRLSSSSPYLRSIHTLLKIHGDDIPTQILNHVQSNMDRILFMEFPSLCQVLSQCSEQNWSISNALCLSNSCDNDASKLGKEKGILAEIEEELCKRMNGLIEMTLTVNSKNNDDFVTNKYGNNQNEQDIFDKLSINEEFMTMSKLCQTLFCDSKYHNDSNANTATEHHGDDDGDKTKDKEAEYEDNDGDEKKKDERETKYHDFSEVTASQHLAADALGMLSSWGQ